MHARGEKVHAGKPSTPTGRCRNERSLSTKARNSPSYFTQGSAHPSGTRRKKTKGEVVVEASLCYRKGNLALKAPGGACVTIFSRSLMTAATEPLLGHPLFSTAAVTWAQGPSAAVQRQAFWELLWLFVFPSPVEMQLTSSFVSFSFLPRPSKRRECAIDYPSGSQSAPGAAVMSEGASGFDIVKSALDGDRRRGA